MRTMRLPRMLALGALGALVLPAHASASGGDVIADCTKHGTLTKRYSQKDYTQALASLPADIEEYGNCRNVIRDAQLAGASNRSRGGGGAGGVGVGTSAFRTTGGPGVPTAPGTGGTEAGSSGSKGDDPNAIDPESTTASNPTTTDENRALIDATRNGGGAVKVGEDAIRPGTSASDRYAQGLPAPLIGVLSLLGVASIVGAVLALRRRWRRSRSGSGA
jgi:hypothetical protein